MKTIVKRMVWGAVTAVSFAALTVSLQAKDALGNVEKATKLIGTDVRNASDQNIGKIEDLVADLESGRVLYAVVSVGGFLGVGDRLVAVPPGAFREQGNHLRIDADKQKLTDAPQFSKDDDREAEMFSPSFVAGAYRHFGQNAWFEGGTATTASSGHFGSVRRVSDLLGMDVKSVSNQKIGDVNNVMIDLPAGRVVYVIFSPDRELDLKNNLYALPPNALGLASDKKSLTTGIDRSKLAAAPSFDKSNWPDMSNPSWASRVYQYYGKQAYFSTGALRPTSERTNSQDRLYREPDQNRQ